MSGLFVRSNFYSGVDYLKFIKSTKTLKRRGPDEEGYLFLENFSMGVQRLAIVDKENGKQPLSVLNHHLVYNGQIYNYDELLRDLQESGQKISSHSDTELLIKLLMENNVEVLNKINGMFAFVMCQNHKLIAARDPLGVKPLYYTIDNGDIIIASEIKAILNYTKKAIMDKEGLCELLGLLPSHSPGSTLYKDIYELKPGHYLEFDKTNGLVITKYHSLKAKACDKNLKDTISHVKYLVQNSCKSQMRTDVGYSSLLSGGLDSSIICSILSEEKEGLSTYSLDYEGNSSEYQSNKYETSKDQDYIKYMIDYKNLNHKTLVLDNNTLLDYLKTAVILRDGPGMADIDASLFWLAKKIKKKHSVCFSGEGADEIFGGYPWFYDEKDYDMFPWIRNLDFRQSLLNKNLDIDIKNYVKDKYQEIIKEAPVLPLESEERKKERQLSYINQKYFMAALLERKDRMTMGASLEARMPFGDIRLVEFLYNVPFKFKYFNNQEKALLREAFKDVLPKEIFERKKSPYPKTRSKKYSNLIKKALYDILDDESSIIHQIFDTEKLKSLINQEDDLEEPWYGQLMKLDQLLAFIYQIDFWFREYKVVLDIT